MTPRLPRLLQTSLGMRAYAELKTAILGGHFAPGAILAETEMAHALGISRTPVREALARLRTEGLVVSLEGGGSAVFAPSEKADRELLLLLDALEQVAVPILAKTCDKSQIAALEEILDEQRLAQRSDNAERFLEADERFHFTICRLAGLNLTAEIITSLQERMRLTELALISQKDRRAAILHEHTAILRALSMRDATRAVRAVRRHVAATRAVLEKRMSNRRENSPAQTCDTVAP